MATAQAAYVGPGFEEGKLPRLLFVSSDTCDASWYKDNPKLLTLEGVRKTALSDRLKNVEPKGHWYKTLDLARKLLAPFAKDRLAHPLNIDGVLEYVAHARSTRCKDISIGKGEGKEDMYLNCRGFVKGEVVAMQPDIIITQGARAREALKGAFPVERHVAMPGYPGHKAHFEIINISDNHKAIKIVAWHPCAHWRGKDKQLFAEWAAKNVQEFIPGS